MPDTSIAWVAFLDRLREVAQLWRADPSSPYYLAASGTAPNLRLSSALGRSSVLLTCGHLQGYVESVVQEFLERIDDVGVVAGQLPSTLRGELCVRYPYAAPNAKRFAKAEEVHRSYLPLWMDDAPIPPGTLRTDSLVDSVWNPWPHKVVELLGRIDIDLSDRVASAQGAQYWLDLCTYVNELIEKRNGIAHGDENVSVTPDDARRYMQWSTRLARACEVALADALEPLVGQPRWIGPNA